MSPLYFLKKQDIGRHCRDGLLDAMDARSRTNGANAFVNIPGRDAKFHAGASDIEKLSRAEAIAG